MDKAITTTFMIIVSVIVSVMVFNTVYAAVARSGDALVNMRTRVDDRMKSQVEIIHATGELNSGSWQDLNGNGTFDVFIWVKNIGATRINAVNQIDVFVGPQGNFMRIPYQDDAGGGYPYWDLDVENGSAWDPTATVRITIHYGSMQASGRYYVKVVIPNGMATDDYFSM